MQTHEIIGNNVDRLPQLIQPSVAKIIKLQTVTKVNVFVENTQQYYVTVFFSHNKTTPKATSILGKINNSLFGLQKMEYAPGNKKMTLSLVTKKALMN